MKAFLSLLLVLAIGVISSSSSRGTGDGRIWRCCCWIGAAAAHSQGGMALSDLDHSPDRNSIRRVLQQQQGGNGSSSTAIVEGSSSMMMMKKRRDIRLAVILGSFSALIALLVCGPLCCICYGTKRIRDMRRKTAATHSLMFAEQWRAYNLFMPFDEAEELGGAALCWQAWQLVYRPIPDELNGLSTAIFQSIPPVSGLIAVDPATVDPAAVNREAGGRGAVDVGSADDHGAVDQGVADRERAGGDCEERAVGRGTANQDAVDHSAVDYAVDQGECGAVDRRAVDRRSDQGAVDQGAVNRGCGTVDEVDRGGVDHVAVDRGAIDRAAVERRAVDRPGQRRRYLQQIRLNPGCARLRRTQSLQCLLPLLPLAASSTTRGTATRSLPFVSYFEVRVVSFCRNGKRGRSSGSISGRMAIGLAARPAPPFRLPGHDMVSLGFHSNGCIYINDPHDGVQASRRWNYVGVTVGCGYDLARGVVFFTLDGAQQLLTDFAFRADSSSIPSTTPHLFPVVGADCDVTCVVNLGQNAFLFDAANATRCVHSLEQQAGRSGDLQSCCSSSAACLEQQPLLDQQQQQHRGQHRLASQLQMSSRSRSFSSGSSSSCSGEAEAVYFSASDEAFAVLP